MFNEYTIQDFLNILFKRWWILIVGFIVGGVLSYIYSSYFINPTYISTGTLYVNNRTVTNATGMLNQNDLNVSLRLVDTYRIILKSDRFMQIVADKANVPLPSNKISSMVTLSGVESTEVLEVSVKSTDPEIAQIICQTILVNAKDEIIRVVEAGSVKVVDDASLPTHPSSPSIPRNTAVGIVLGMVLAVLIAFMFEILDISVKDEEDLILQYGIPVVGIIPSFDDIGNTATNKNGRKGRGYVYEK